MAEGWRSIRRWSCRICRWRVRTFCVRSWSGTNLSPSLAQAQNLHKLSSLGKLDESAIEAVLLTEPVLKKKVTLKVERIAPCFPRGTNPEEMEAVILRLLASWQRSREQKRAHESGEC